MPQEVVALGHLSLMLARRAKGVLELAGIPAEVFRDEGIFRAAQRDYAGRAGLAYLRLYGFDPDAFGLTVPQWLRDDAVSKLEDAGIPIGVLAEGVEDDASDARRDIPAGEPSDHPYRSPTEERVCLRCGEPERATRSSGAPCAKCGGQLGTWELWVSTRRRATHKWRAVFVVWVLALLASGAIVSPRLIGCRSTLELTR